MLTKNDIAFIKSLSSRQERYASGLFVAEGAKLVEDLHASGMQMERTYHTSRYLGPVTGMEIPEREMERISHLKTHSPVLALVRIPDTSPAPVALTDGLVLALDAIQDPGNMGTIVRLCDWFGIRRIYCSPETVDCYNPKVIQATMGAIARVRVVYGPLEPTLKEAAEKGIGIFGTYLDGENIYDADLPASGIVVMGNEGGGISSSVGDIVTRRLHIPPYPAGAPSSESLNVGIATAIVCSEFRRRRHRLF